MKKYLNKLWEFFFGDITNIIGYLALIALIVAFFLYQIVIKLYSYG
jgi:hypothetical protein